MLAAEAQGAFAGRAVGRGVDHAGNRFIVGQDLRRAFDPDPGRGAVEHLPDAAPVGDEGGRGAQRAAAPFGLGQGFDGVALGEQGGFGLGRAGRARQGADRGAQADDVEPLALEGVGGVLEPGAGRAARAQAQAPCRASRDGGRRGCTARWTASARLRAACGARTLDQLGEKGVGGSNPGPRRGQAAPRRRRAFAGRQACCSPSPYSSASLRFLEALSGDFIPRGVKTEFMRR